MNAKLKNTALFLDDDWIDEDDAPEFSDEQLETLNMTFKHRDKVICEAKGLSALREKMCELNNQKQTIKLIRFKQRGVQIRQQLAQMRQMMMQRQQVA
ncbi:MAG: hypothetical protein WCL34_00035 [Methylococcaceae bacterium]|jgi:hypothetical protein